MKLLPLTCSNRHAGSNRLRPYQNAAEAPARSSRQGTLGQQSRVAKAEAAKNNKLVFVDFTGSDWCPPCMACMTKCSRKKRFSISRKTSSWCH